MKQVFLKTMMMKIIFILFFFFGINLYAAASVNETDPEGTIFVEAIDADEGLPLDNADVTLYKFEDNKWMFVAGMKTDLKGCTRFANLQVGGKYKVEISKSGYNTQIHGYENLGIIERIFFAMHVDTTSASNFLDKCSRFIYFMLND